MAARVREGQGQAVAVPRPVPLERIRRVWDDLPELACVESWQQACRAWWDDPADGRLRKAAHDALWLTDVQLAAWLQQPLDANAVIRAHRHVTATRAGVEADLSRRKLEPSELRTMDAWTELRDGTRRMFTAADEIPRALSRACSDFAQAPGHPFLRAAWLSQILGVVHPFRDANGGTSRFLASLELAREALPPLVLSYELRNGPYIKSMPIEDNLDPLALVMYEAVQQQLALALLAGRPRGAWDEQKRVRVERWVASSDAAVRARIGTELAVERVADDDGALARIARAGLRMAAVPSPRYTSWRIASPVPAYVDLAKFVVNGGPRDWLGAVITARAGDRGVLGSSVEHQHVATYFVAADGEADANVDARFARWLDNRLSQIVQGLARWM